MKKGTINQTYSYLILAIEAILCILFSTILPLSLSSFTTVIAFPFEPVGNLLRMLSLSGSFGNVIAIVIYVILCLLPMGFLFLNHRKQNYGEQNQQNHRKQKLHLEDVLLVLLTFVLFAVLYLMINPGEIAAYLGQAAQAGIAKAILGTVTYSIIIGYGVIHLVRLFVAAQRVKIQKYLSVLLFILNAVFVYVIFGANVRTLASQISDTRAANAGNESALTLTYVFLGLQYIVNVLPYVLDILIVGRVLTLVGEIAKDRYSQSTVLAAKRLSKTCCCMLSITVVSDLVFNILQLIAMRQLVVVNTVANIPVLSILFVLMVLLLTQFIHENTALKEDNNQLAGTNQQLKDDNTQLKEDNQQLKNDNDLFI